jgi:hypothetical protein
VVLWYKLFSHHQPNLFAMLVRAALFAVVLCTVETAPPKGRNECDTAADGQCIGPRSAALLQTVRTSEERQALVETDEAVDELGHMHAQSLLHLETLAKLKNGNGELPETVRTLLITIKNHSEKVQTKLSAEHTTQKTALQTKFDAIAACESHLSVVATVSSDNSSSLKSLAAQALQSLCSCRLTQAQKDADSKGCEDQLACYLSNRDAKQASLNTHLRKANGDAREVYQDPTDMCANSDDWANAAGSTDADKAVAWLTSQKTSWESALDAKITSIQNLQTEYNQWHAKYEALKDGTGTFQGKGCEDLRSIKNTHDNTCSLKQAQATLRQCVYSEEVKNGCDQYTVCRTAAVTAWNTKKNEQNTSSQDRRDAWVSASQIMCLVDKLLSNTTISGTCSDTCDANCENNTDLSAILTRSYADATTCTVPGKSCDTWTPTCSASGWSTHTAAYLVGNRTTGCDGSPAAAALTMPAGDTCQACGNIAMCDSFTCQVGHTNRGFNVRCPGGVCNATTCCLAPAPTEAPTDSPTAAPTADPTAAAPSLSENEWENADGATVTKSNGVLTFPSKWFRNTAIGTNGLLQPPYEVWWEVRRILPSGNGGLMPVCSNTKDQNEVYTSGTYQWRHNANSWGINPGGKFWKLGNTRGDTRSDPWPATEHWFWQGTYWGADKTVKFYFGRNNQTREEVKAAGPWIAQTAPSELNGECYMWFWPYHNTPYEMRNFIVE